MVHWNTCILSIVVNEHIKWHSFVFSLSLLTSLIPAFPFGGEWHKLWPQLSIISLLFFFPNEDVLPGTKMRYKLEYNGYINRNTNNGKSIQRIGQENHWEKDTTILSLRHRSFFAWESKHVMGNINYWTQQHWETKQTQSMVMKVSLSLSLSLSRFLFFLRNVALLEYNRIED